MIVINFMSVTIIEWHVSVSKHNLVIFRVSVSVYLDNALQTEQTLGEGPQHPSI